MGILAELRRSGRYGNLFFVEKSIQYQLRRSDSFMERTICIPAELRRSGRCEGAGDYREACSALLHGDPFGGGFNRKPMPALRAVHFSFQGFRSSKLG